MTGKITIDAQRCKGCGLCVWVCPRGGIAISSNSNNMGYFTAEDCDGGCNGCAMCALVCPDAAIEVAREKPLTVDPEPRNNTQTKLTREGK